MSWLLLGIQAAVLLASLVLLVRQWNAEATVPAASTVAQDLYDIPISMERAPLGAFGAVQITSRVHNGCLPDGAVALSVDLPRLQIIEVWAGVAEGWIQMVPAGADRWRSPLLRNHGVHRLRLWVSPAGHTPDRNALVQAAPMLLAATTLLSNQDPLGTPVSDPASSLAAWVAHQRGDVLVAGLLDEWSATVVQAGAAGWPLEVPVGDALLDHWAEKAMPSDDPAALFSRWFLGRIGLASRRGLDSRAIAELRDPISRKVMQAAARLVRGLDERLEVRAECPRAVGPKHKDTWLVDLNAAAQIENPVVAGLVQPMLVLRPALVCDGIVLLEGEVA